MKYRRLGRTGMVVSVVGVGTWQLGGEWGRDYVQTEADAIFDAARECGINFVDTAECYGDHVSEALVGGAINRDRDQWVVATKFGHRFTKRFERDTVYDLDGVQKQLDDSLKALRTDRIDLYQFHSGPDDQFDRDELWTFLAKQKLKGKIRFLGISISPNTNIHQTARATKVGADTIQVVYNRLDQVPEQAVLPSCAEQDLGVLARVPLASGFLSGKYKPGHRFGTNDVRSQRNTEQDDKRLREVERIAREEVPAGVPMAQWALTWCLKHPSVCAVIPGCKDAQQVRNNAAAADLGLVREDHPKAAARPR
jgi:aryl-alcohol dehydrogenase-like predicted oxidoreductase